MPKTDYRFCQEILNPNRLETALFYVDDKNLYL